MQRIFLTLATVFALSTSLAAQDYAVGIEALRAKNYQVALAELRPLAKQGDAEAQNCLGFMYLYGKGVEQDFDAAVHWYTLAAEQEHTEAIYSLGDLSYYAGESEKSLLWFRKGAKLGHLNSQYSLAFFLMDEEGPKEDQVEAIYWYRKVASRDFSAAQHNLAYSYSQGRGVTQSYVLSYMWYQISEANGGSASEANWRVFLGNITPAEIALAKEMAIICVDSGYQTCE